MKIKEEDPAAVEAATAAQVPAAYKKGKKIYGMLCVPTRLYQLSRTMDMMCGIVWNDTAWKQCFGFISTKI